MDTRTSSSALLASVDQDAAGKHIIKNKNKAKVEEFLKFDYLDKESYWVYMFYLLMVFQQREGHTDVPLQHLEQGWQLGKWLKNQRELHSRNRLDPTRFERLEQAGVAWDLLEKHWDTMYALLKMFVEREGHAHVPQWHFEDDKKLGQWLNTQRAAFRQATMDKRRQRKLEAVGVVWNHFTAKWERMYRLLCKFQTREGHVKVSLKHKEEGEKLGTWLASQRKFIKAGSLQEDRLDKLKSMGVCATNFKINK